MAKFFASDLHLSHAFMLKTRMYLNEIGIETRFETVEEMDDFIINIFSSILKKGDSLYLLGDIAYSIEALDKFIKSLDKSIQIHLIKGNHDRLGLDRFKKRFSSISDYKEIKIKDTYTTLCHYPGITWNKSHFNSWMLFGHHHKNSHGWDQIDSKTVGKMLNVNIEFNNYKPWHEDDIATYMDGRPDNWDKIDKNED